MCKLSFISLVLIMLLSFYNIDSYIKDVIDINIISKLSILNNNEKDVGPADDIYVFVVLFIITIVFFMLSSVYFLIIQMNGLLWSLTCLITIVILVLTIPLNLFIDFGWAFLNYIRGSSTSDNFFIELIFDLLATLTIFVRFVIQNIRFLFIFGAIFELLEWIFLIDSNLFLLFNTNNPNFLLNLTSVKYLLNSDSVALIIVNLILFFILYVYYVLHLIFLLLVQISVYIGISSWLFFFLYSTKFLNKNEKHILYKKFM